MNSALCEKAASSFAIACPCSGLGVGPLQHVPSCCIRSPTALCATIGADTSLYPCRPAGRTARPSARTRSAGTSACAAPGSSSTWTRPGAPSASTSTSACRPRRPTSTPSAPASAAPARTPTAATSAPAPSTHLPRLSPTRLMWPPGACACACGAFRVPVSCMLRSWRGSWLGLKQGAGWVSNRVHCKMLLINANGAYHWLGTRLTPEVSTAVPDLAQVHREHQGRVRSGLRRLLAGGLYRQWQEQDVPCLQGQHRVLQG